MAFKMMGGKPLKQKTGAGIPIQMKSALYQRDMLTRVKEGVMAGIKGFNAEPKVTVGGQGGPGSGSRQGNKDLIEMSKNAITAASKAFKKKDPKPDPKPDPKKAAAKTPPGRQMKKGGPKQQTRKDKLDERLGMKDGAEKDKLQSMTSRRNESAAMQKKPKKKGGMKQMDKKAPAKQTASQKANLPAKLVKILSTKKAKKGAPKQMDKKGGPKEYGKGPKQKESVKQEKKDLDINFLAEKMEPKTK